MMISVIVPCYNASLYIERTIKAFADQNYSDFEVIFINDCSTDNTAETIARFIEKYKLNARIINNRVNLGPSLSRLEGIKASNATYIAFCDSDDWFSFDYLKTMVDCIKENDKDIVFCNYQLVYDSGKIRERIVLEKRLERDRKSFLTVDVDGLWCGLYKRTLFDSIEFPNLRNGEDMAIIPVLISRAEKVGVVSKPLYNYFQRSGSLSTTPTTKMIDDLIASYRYVCTSINDSDLYDEIEYIGVRNVLYGALLNLCKIKKSRKKVRRIIQDFNASHSGWKSNRYLPGLPKYKKVFLFFVRTKSYLALRALAGVHTLLSSK